MYHMPSRALSTRFYFFLFCGLIAANISVYKALFTPRVLEVRVLSVGKGDATLVRTPGGKTLLIDAGPDASILRALGSALPMWQKYIDAIILTSPKTPFVGGLPEVESRYHISTPVIHIGDAAAPYGASFAFDNSLITIIAPATLSISYGATTLATSSTTPEGFYISNGQTISH